MKVVLLGGGGQVRMLEAVILVAVQNIQSIAVFLGAALAGLAKANVGEEVTRT